MTYSSAELHDAATPFLDRTKTGVLLVDHQVGLLSGVRDTDIKSLTGNLVSLIKVASVFGLPTVVTNVSPQMWGPLIPEAASAIREVTGEGLYPIIERTTINAFDDDLVREAIGATRRTQWLVAGISTEVCAGFPALSLKAQGLDSRVVLDASGTFSQVKRETGIARLTMAGIQVVDVATAAVEILHDNADPLAGPVYGALNLDVGRLLYQFANA